MVGVPMMFQVLFFNVVPSTVETFFWLTRSRLYKITRSVKGKLNCITVNLYRKNHGINLGPVNLDKKVDHVSHTDYIEPYRP